MEASPSLGASGTIRARAALLATTTCAASSSLQLPTGSSGDRHVVFLASGLQRNSGIDGSINSNDNRTWPHHWSPHQDGCEYKSIENSPHVESKMRVPRAQSSWTDEVDNTSSFPRQQILTTTTANSSSNHHRRHHQSTSGNNSMGESPVRCTKSLNYGVYGWRKRCLYFLILGLAVIVILNLALTLWLLKVMEFSFDGIGSLKVIPGGIELHGQAAILDALIASSVKSRRGSNLVLESWTNFTASARSDTGQIHARFTLSEDKVECVAKAFRITDPNGELLFSSSNDRVVLGAKSLKVTGVGGAVFEGSVETRLVTSAAGQDLKLESATRSLEIRAPQKVVIESSAGELSASSLSELRLASREGSLKLEARSVYIRGLTYGTTPSLRKSGSTNGSSSATRSEGVSVHQLCACEDGKLFLAPPDVPCQADHTLCH